MAQTKSTANPDFPDLIQASLVGCDRALEITLWNAASEELYGWTRDEAIGRNARELLLCSDPDSLADVEAALLASGGWRGELSRKTKSGATVLVAVSWSVLRNEDGDIVEIIETGRNITEEREAESALKRSELKYRSLFDHMPIALFQLDPSKSRQVFRALRDEGMTDFLQHVAAHPDVAFRLVDAIEVTDANEEAVRMLGAGNRSELLGPLSRIWTDMDQYVASLDARLHGARFYSGNGRITTLDGRDLEIFGRVGGAGDLADQDVSLLGIIDITSQTRAFEAVERSEAKYRNLFQHMPVGLFQTDTSALLEEFGRLRVEGVEDLLDYMESHPDFYDRACDLLRIEEVNARTVDLFGGSDPQDFVGSIGHYFQLSPDTLRRNLAARYAGDEYFSEEIRGVGLDGRIINVLYSSTFSPALNKQGIGLVSTIDIGRRVEAESKLRQVQAEFAHAGRVASLGELATSIAHEVNQPLAAIVTSGETSLRWLRDARPDLDEVRQLATRMVSDARRAADIIAHMRAMASRRAPSYEATSVEQLVHEVLSFLKHELAANSVSTHVELATDLPPVLADRTQVQQVLLNLVVNAMQAMTQHGIAQPAVTIRAVSDLDAIRFEVEDNGPGIPADHVARVFDSFFTTKPDGLGIGLPICRSIIEAHDGSIDCVSLPAGTRFTFTLPEAGPVEA